MPTGAAELTKTELANAELANEKNVPLFFPLFFGSEIRLLIVILLFTPLFVILDPLSFLASSALASSVLVSSAPTLLQLYVVLLHAGAKREGITPPPTTVWLEATAFNHTNVHPPFFFLAKFASWESVKR